MGMWTGIIILFINIYGFFLMGFDKKLAKQKQFRISERSLWIAAICGGAAGTTLGMHFFRHKTKHTAFRVGFPLLVVVQIVAFLYVYKN
ncbi:DUF1294 domain-containing protein [Bacillus sp. CGMCC 1.16607]|uniref:DUF1294 domain-containing protein n=1 Tax=Bacillus sp. CGMCC 1.16607 TaxID=3351842 RepID=UPI00362811F8